MNETLTRNKPDENRSAADGERNGTPDPPPYTLSTEGARDGNNAPATKNRLLWWMGGALALALVLFFTGFALGRGGLNEARTELRRARTDYDARLKSAQTDTEQARSNLASAQALNRLLIARGYLYRAAVQIGRRNFGTAQNDLERATLLIQQADANAAGVDAGAVSRLQESVAGLNLRVTTDVAGQRDQILQAVEQMDGLLVRHLRQTA